MNILIATGSLAHSLLGSNISFFSAVKHFGLAVHWVTLCRSLGHTLPQLESHFVANFEIVVFLEHVCKVRASWAE